ncbi:MFS transporter [Pseudomarimonas salicorniae]|uniref:MFS transporter n=1 Tax=Pseudomarimonas salicorniae TaxID=2933270 RepID=A0ABT0GDW7_9GAMM|nr:MFS transporter [Lysobacter sp. CAU 1642]MCK7592745.1 MFS transporter [Lysobacter sp. CAU 1642]
MSGQSQFALLQSRRFLPFFCTQALGAFNDNVFKNALIILIAFQGATLAGLASTELTIAAAGIFILPFFLFSATFGQLADKYDKSRLIRAAKLLEIGVMGLAALGFALGSIELLLGVLFLMGTQSTLFGPAKYGILPQHLAPEELVGGNGLIESATFLTILLGTMTGGILIALQPSGPIIVSVSVVLIAVIGYLASRAIPPAPPSAPDLAINWNPLSETWRNLRFLSGNRTVFLSVLGISWFWFFGATILQVLPSYTKDILGGSEQVATLVLVLFSLGIGIGSLLCEKLSHRTVEIGLVPLGAAGMTLFGVDLYLAHPEAAGALDLGARAFAEREGSWRVMLDLVLIGLFGGFFIVPLYALVQQRAERAHISRVIAGNNILNAAFMVVSALLSILLLKWLTIPELLLATALLNAVVAVYIFSLVPEFAMRFVAWGLVNLLYRVEVRGVERHVPDEGPALLVCNHVSYVDALVLGGSIPRPVRFVMYYKIHRIPLLGWLFRTARTIPIAGAKEDPALMEKAFEEVRSALRAGEIVGIFPEGALTRDGQIAPFRGGVERILAETPVAVVPMAITGLWESMWSRRDSRLGRMRVPRRLRAHIGVVAGPALPPTSSAAELEEAVRALRGDRA